MDEIRPLPRDRVDEAAAVLARSFHEDPGFGHVFPDERRRARALPPFMLQAVADAVPFGAVDAAFADGRLAGVAVWLPPGAFPLTTARKVRAVPRLLRVLAAAPRSFPAFARLGANIEEAHPGGAVWYLEVVGVAPEAQGGGLGTRLLEPGLARADRDALPCYLETVSERLAGWYERLGFRVERDGCDFLAGGPAYRTMLRPPAAPRPDRA